MKHLLIILIFFLLLTSPVIGDNHKGETLYRWGDVCCDYKWMGFGKIGTHPKYQGQVKDGKPNGLGIITRPNGEEYVGSWKNGKWNGHGTYTWSNGKYVGSWKDGNRNGQGTYTSPTFLGGGRWVGEWKNDNTWNGERYDKDGKITYKVVNGKKIK